MLLFALFCLSLFGLGPLSAAIVLGILGEWPVVIIVGGYLLACLFDSKV